MNVISKDIDTIIPTLENSRLGAHLSREELEMLTGFCELRHYEPGETVIVEGSMGHEMFIVVDQTVVVEISAASTGKNAYVDTLCEGEIIGETALFVNAKRTAHVKAPDGAKLLVLSRPGFFSLLKERGKLGIKFLFMIIYGLIGRLRAANEELAFERRSDSSQGDIDDLIAGMVPDDALRALENLKGNGDGC
ncbi:cyclic nucleotide-binding domain-containing protein [Spirochaeta lutea]|uniref:Cyclic nucleotide-binding domain-containing protein n=1 Tax=Spirochaeta lutea TaxID=1480694 RepID=A0A098QWD9_9SPIO|nr:cyclic nucleotide-binding domain-containing protein [Spirochaeta lutea]KGE72034.1 hypothetical protein DC28_07955 [Spirochaeta lutea]